MKKPVIICVDDEPIILTSLKAQLRRAFSEFEIETVENGEEAIQLIGEIIDAQQDFPLIISDHIMPGIKGDELLKHVHQISPKTIKILLTGQANAEAIGNAVNFANLYRYITKPWDVKDLEMTVSEAIKRYYQEKKLDELIEQLHQNNEQLEEKVQERTSEVMQQSAEIKKQKELIQRKNDDILASINYAKRIQDAMLPRNDKIKKYLPDSFIIFKPRDSVSGDFYWFNALEAGRWVSGNEASGTSLRIVLVAADCTGHGVPGAFMSMRGDSLLNQLVNVQNITEPDTILNEMNREIYFSLKQDETNNRDGMDISLCVLDYNQKIVEFAGARNPLIYIQNDENGTPEIFEIRGDRMTVGGLQVAEGYSFTKHYVPLNKPTSFYMFSDGFQDQFGGSDKRKFMIKRMKEMFLSIANLPMEEQKIKIEKELEDWRRKEDGSMIDQIDDILLIGFRLDW